MHYALIMRFVEKSFDVTFLCDLIYCFYQADDKTDNKKGEPEPHPLHLCISRHFDKSNYCIQ